MRWALSLVTVLLLTVQVSAQECVEKCRVRIGEPFVVFTNAQPGALWYRLHMNGIEQFMQPVLRNGEAEFAFPNGLARGRYTFVIDVVRQDESTVSTLPGELRVAGKGVDQ